MGIVSDLKGAAKQDSSDFMAWAFGPDDGRPLPERWNKLHGDLFTVSETDEPKSVIPRMVEAHMKSRVDATLKPKAGDPTHA